MDLTTKYLGMELRNPIVASASPLSRTVEGIRSLADAGAGAIVLFSLFAEQINWDVRYYDGGTSGTGLPHAPDWRKEPVGTEEYLDLIRLAKRSIDVPVIGSLNGFGPGDWTHYARLIEEAGADALELNLYHLPTDSLRTSAAVEKDYLATVREVRGKVSCPLAVKITPYFSSLPAMAVELVQAGADGLVLFNRFYQPDFDIEARSAHAPGLTLSTPDDLRVPLRWISRLYGTLNADLALTGGVHSHEDVIKAIMAGADVAMMASELISRGPGRIGEILGDLSPWLEAHHCADLGEIRGVLSAWAGALKPGSSERTGYINTIRSEAEKAATVKT